MLLNFNLKYFYKILYNNLIKIRLFNYCFYYIIWYIKTYKLLFKVKKLEEKMKKLIKKMEDSSIAFTILASFFFFFLIEVLSEGCLKGAINHIIGNPLIFVYSVMILFATYQLAFLLKRRIFYVSLVSIIWIGLATTNAIVLSNRITPLTYIDLKMLSNVLTILNKYLNGFQIALIVIGLILVLVCLVLMFIYSPRRSEKIS